MAVPAQDEIDNLTAQDIIDKPLEYFKQLEKERKEQIRKGWR